MHLDGLPAARRDLVGEGHRPLDDAHGRGVAEDAARRTEPRVLEDRLARPERARLVLAPGGDELAHVIGERTRSEGRREGPGLAAVEALIAQVLQRGGQTDRAREVRDELAFDRGALLGPGRRERRWPRVDTGAGIDPHGDRQGLGLHRRPEDPDRRADRCRRDLWRGGDSGRRLDGGRLGRGAADGACGGRPGREQDGAPPDAHARDRGGGRSGAHPSYSRAIRVRPRRRPPGRCPAGPARSPSGRRAG